MKIYGHPPEIRIDALTTVPWLVTNGHTRKEVTAEESSRTDSVEGENIKQRLSDLGYT